MKMHTALCLLVFGASPALAQSVYKSVDETGRVTYSQRPPAGALRSVEQIPLQPVKAPASAAHAEERAARMIEAAKAVEAQIDDRIATRARMRQEVEGAREALAKAERELEEGRAPLPGERRPNRSSGGAIFSDAYYRRVGVLEQAVEAARKNLQDARHQLSAFSSQ